MLSIITPVFNGEKYIASCMENVACQDCEYVEHLVIDGGSEDRTMEVVKRFADSHLHLRIYSGKDSGQSEAMNKGLRLAHGEIIGFLNVDDFYEPGILKRVLSLFQHLPKPSLAIANCNIIDADGILIGMNRPAQLSILDLVKGRECPYNPSSYFYHKKIHDQIGYYDEKEHLIMDLDFLFRALRVAKVNYYNETWGNFRWMEGTKTFEDFRAGLMFKRSQALRDKYYCRLSLVEKISMRGYKVGILIKKYYNRRLGIGGKKN